MEAMMGTKEWRTVISEIIEKEATSQFNEMKRTIWYLNEDRMKLKTEIEELKKMIDDDTEVKRYEKQNKPQDDKDEEVEIDKKVVIKEEEMDEGEEEATIEEKVESKEEENDEGEEEDKEDENVEIEATVEIKDEVEEDGEKDNKEEEKVMNRVEEDVKDDEDEEEYEDEDD